MVGAKNDYSSIKVHKRAPSITSNTSQPSNSPVNPTTSNSGHHHHHHHHNNNTRASEKAKAARRRAQYLSTASRATELAQDYCTFKRSNWRAAQKAKGVLKPRSRRPNPSEFCRELKLLSGNDEPVSAQRRRDLVAKAREALGRQADGLERKKKGGKELREKLLGLKAYFESAGFKGEASEEASEEDSGRDFGALRGVLEPVDELLRG